MQRGKYGMRFRELFEGKWWDDTETVTLYHGTSSALQEIIERDGLHPPSEDLQTYAHEILSHYIPREEWTPGLLKLVDEHAVRSQAGRSGDKGSAIYCFTSARDVYGYARAYAKDGGEIAADIRTCVAIEKKGDNFERGSNDITPRFPEGLPIVVEIEIPKSWCNWYIEPSVMVSKVKLAWEEKASWTRGARDLDELLDDVYQKREVLVNRVVPPSAIRSIRIIRDDEQETEMWD
jgi:hypothetical protein